MNIECEKENAKWEQIPLVITNSIWFKNTLLSDVIKDPPQEKEEVPKKVNWLAWICIAGGIVIIIWGARLGFGNAGIGMGLLILGLFIAVALIFIILGVKMLQADRRQKERRLYGG